MLRLEERSTGLFAPLRRLIHVVSILLLTLAGSIPARASELELPGNIQAITEAPILARADGYLKRRLADIGDRVRAGQVLALCDELDAAAGSPARRTA